MTTLAERIAVEMEIHAAIGTTTRGKIEAIEALLTPGPVTREDAIAFLETATRNWSHVPELEEEDIGDVSMALLQFLSARR